MIDEKLIITKKEYNCTHCKKELPGVQRAFWLQKICEHFQYDNKIKIHVTRRNVSAAEAPISVLKQAFMLEESSRNIILVKNKKTKQEIKVVEIVLEKIPAIRS